MDKATFIEQLLREREEMYLELSKLRKVDQGALDEAEQNNEKYQQVIDEKDEKIKKLSDQLAWYRRKFWHSSSEKFIASDPSQRKIDWSGLEVLPEEKSQTEEAEKEIVSYERKKLKKKGTPKRVSIPENLRREVEIIEPEGVDEAWIKIGEEITEVLECKPGEVYVRRIVRPKYALKEQETKSQKEDQKQITIAQLPLLPIPRGNAGASLLADLLISKYLYHIPFHRKIAMLKQSNLQLPASTVNDWFSKSSDLLRALYERLKEVVLKSDYIGVDESTIPVIHDKKHRTVKAYLWAVRSVMDELVFFHYDKGSRAQKVIVDLLKEYQGAIQTDGYGAYSVYERKKGVLLLGCWAHARRKFNEALKEDKEKAEYALEQIRMIYTVETMCDDKNLSFEQRAAERTRLAYPILTAFEKWIYKELDQIKIKGRLYQALNYTYNIYHRLSRYHLDGRYRLDNNLIENDMRALALGRKNYMFAGNHEAAENTAVMYSLMACCKSADADPHLWLTDVLNKIPYYNLDYSKDLVELLPHNWKKSNKL